MTSEFVDGKHPKFKHQTNRLVKRLAARQKSMTGMKWEEGGFGKG